MHNAFLCHNSEDSGYVIEVAKYLTRSLENVFYFENHQRAGKFLTAINRALSASNVMVIFLGKTFTDWQREESNSLDVTSGFSIFLIQIGRNGEFSRIPEEISIYRNSPTFQYDIDKVDAAKDIAYKIVNALGLLWISVDDLPHNPYLFSSEKEIISFFKKKEEIGRRVFDKEPSNDQEEKDFEEIREKLLQGCPAAWPTVTQWRRENPRLNELNQKDVGNWRPENSMVMAAALYQYHSTEQVGAPDDLFKRKFVLPEAGPRERLYYPRKRNSLTVGILVSGGIAPGINAVISGILERHKTYQKVDQTKLKVYGYQNGFYAFDEAEETQNLLKLYVHSVQAYEGGSIIGTSRFEDLIDEDTRIDSLKEIDEALRFSGIDILYIIGGDGSMKAAHALWSVAQNNDFRRKNDQPLSVVAIPKTMDNDILWMWQSFGFLSAVQEAREFVERLHVEVKSNPRLCVVQLFGSDSGFVVSHAVLASATGHCDAALIPEIEFSMNGLAEHVRMRILQRGENIPSGLVVMAETAIPRDAMNYVDRKSQNYVEIGLTDDEKKAITEYEEMRQKGQRIQGQTNDYLRSAGLKIVSEGLKRLLMDPVKRTMGFEPHWNRLRVFTNEPRHLLRATRPTTSDFILAHRLGTLAVDNAMAGYTDFMISQWVTEFVLVPLKLVVLGRKRVPEHGIFWKSVLAKTGQPAHMI